MLIGYEVYAVNLEEQSDFFRLLSEFTVCGIFAEKVKIYGIRSNRRFSVTTAEFQQEE